MLLIIEIFINIPRIIVKMGRKQIAKTLRQKQQRVERLTSMGQPVLKVHQDKYADKVESARSNDNKIEQKGNKSNYQSALEKIKRERNYLKELLNYKSNIALFSDMAYNLSVNGNYIDGLNFVRKLKGLLKGELFDRLGEKEKNDIKETANCLENLCLARAAPFLNDQIFYGSSDLMYLKDLMDTQREYTKRMILRGG